MPILEMEDSLKKCSNCQIIKSFQGYLNQYASSISFGTSYSILKDLWEDVSEKIEDRKDLEEK